MALFYCDRGAEGSLFDPDDWSHEVSIELAKEENLELINVYSSILKFVRAFWEENQIIPDISNIDSHIAQILSITQKQAKILLFVLFRYSHVKQICKVVGMRRPCL